MFVVQLVFEFSQPCHRLDVRSYRIIRIGTCKKFGQNVHLEISRMTNSYFAEYGTDDFRGR